MPLEAVLLLILLFTLAVVIGADIIRADVAAMIALLGLAALQQLPGVTPFVDVTQLFAGFSSRTVIALIGVMIISAALVRCGFINTLADGLLTLAGNSQSRLGSWLLVAVAGFSTVIQNAGAVTLAVPIVSRVAAKLGLENRQLLMPVGRMILLGGCCTLIGNSALLLLNDILPAGIEHFGLLAPLPVGLALVASGLLYNLFQFNLSLRQSTSTSPRRDIKLRAMYQLEEAIRCYHWLEPDFEIDSVAALEDRFKLRVVASYYDDLQLSPTRNATLPSRGYIALMGSGPQLTSFETATGLAATTACTPLQQALSTDYSGLVEMVLTPGSSLVGLPIRDLRLRHHFGLTPLAIYRADGLIEGDIRLEILQAGDTVLAHVSWQELEHIQDTDDFVLLAPDKPESPVEPGLSFRTWTILAVLAVYGLWAQPGAAFLMFAAAAALIAARVLEPEQAYRAVSWRTIFMLACLMPFSQAMTNSGASTWLAEGVMSLLNPQASGLVVLIVFALLAAALGQLISNVAAVVIPVPVAIQVCALGNYEAQGLILLIGISVSNAFLFPTNQVTAFIASAGNFHSRKFLRAGAPSSLIFCAVSVAVIAVMYPSYLG